MSAARCSARAQAGGGLLIVDHAAIDGSEDAAVKALHRIDEGFVRRQLEAHGLTLEAHGDVLRNAEDPRTALVFDASIKGRIDRFLHFYRKPASG